MSEKVQDPDEKKTIPDMLYRIAEESEGGASRVMDQVEISINNFEDIKSLSSELLRKVAASGNDFTLSRDEVIGMAEEILSYAENGLMNLEGIMDLYQYQDIVRQKLEKVGHQLIDVSEYIRSRLVPDVANLSHIPPAGKDILGRNSEEVDERVEDVESVIAQFLQNRA